eukprot:CAMPEP_0206458506 /NCGR_PEP_ID=MMETSP0324_2-20121206/23612_1 /ASSEMBLY_ACC=CAM_ASM_000836 /TAXON_ID=2866 /ORGANISM="Crypthecodinium cohnii, Strain Seligo" /LENGTH=67 /DNA_ID=CAMNT_0053929861 /DNA_START=186 /DNA_END=385 /DNA_ORIENTATION=-
MKNKQRTRRVQKLLVTAARAANFSRCSSLRAPHEKKPQCVSACYIQRSAAPRGRCHFHTAALDVAVR